MVRTARDVIRDTQEANNRKFNIIIHRLEEEQGMSQEIQQKEDIKTVRGILSDIGVTVIDTDIVKCQRLGKKTDDNKRPLLLKVTSLDIKQTIIKKCQISYRLECQTGMSDSQMTSPSYKERKEMHY